ncbi:MAG: VpsF family polysaccharide biosynthesis protein [Methylobacteriaceae bacterium]|nr:VpsF family polysaccharide biosynthesis protein [Methylobacteriaceae bacterium]
MSAASVARESVGADRALRRLVEALVFVGVVALFLISPMLLTEWGVVYELAGGSVIEKIHPGTWAILLALGLVSLRFGNPLAFAARAVAVFPGTAPFLLAFVYLLGHAILVQKTPFTPIIDSFLLPFAALLTLSTTEDALRRRLALALHAALVVNAAIGLGEYLFGFRLTPYVAGEFVIEEDWRSTALLGHPLSNALTTGVYLITLSLGGGRDLPAPLRAVALALCLASMIAFGGRASLVLSLAIMGAVFAARCVGVLRGGRVDLRVVAALAALTPIVAVGLTELYAAGFFDQMLERFVNDRGSAKARLIMFGLFRALSWPEVLFGPDLGKIQALQNLEGVEYGLESFFIAYILTYGLIVSLFFFVGLAFFCREIVRASRPVAIAPLMFFFTVAATSVSLSAKTTTFGMLVALLLTMLRPGGEPTRA